MSVEISGCVGCNIWVLGGQYLGVWVRISGLLFAISGCAGVAIYGCIVGNIWVCGE